MTRIMVGTDGSVNGQGATRWAAEFAAGTGMELLVAGRVAAALRGSLPADQRRVAQGGSAAAGSRVVLGGTRHGDQL